MPHVRSVDPGLTLQLANCSGWIDVVDDGHAQFMGWLEVGASVPSYDDG
jgi:hypothetical protein